MRAFLNCFGKVRADLCGLIIPKVNLSFQPSKKTSFRKYISDSILESWDTDQSKSTIKANCKQPSTYLRRTTFCAPTQLNVNYAKKNYQGVFYYINCTLPYKPLKDLHTHRLKIFKKIQLCLKSVRPKQ